MNDNRPIIGTRYTCILGKRNHRAYYQVGRGGSVIWCPSHGVIVGITPHIYPPGTDEKVAMGRRRMSEEQFKRFWMRRART